MKLITKIAKRLSFEGQKPLSNGTFEPFSTWLVFVITIALATLLMIFYPEITSAIPFHPAVSGYTRASAQYATIMAITGLIVTVLGLACCTSFSRTFWFVVVTFGLSVTFSQLVISNSRILTILTGGTLIWLGLSHASHKSGGLSLLHASRLCLFVAGAFIALGHHGFSYSRWMYELKWGGYSPFEIKDAASLFIISAILLISVLEATTRLVWRPWYRPPHSHRGWTKGLSLIGRAILPSHTLSGGRSYIKGSISGLNQSDIAIGKLMTWCLGVATLALLFIWGSIFWLGSLLVRAVTVNFERQFARSLLDACTPLLFCMAITFSSFYFSLNLSQYPASGVGKIAVPLCLSLVLFSTMLWGLFSNRSSDDAVENQIYQRFATSSTLVLLIVGAVAIIPLSLKFRRVDFLGFAVSLIVLSLSRTGRLLYRHAPSTQTSPPALDRPSSPPYEAYWAVAPFLLFVVSIAPLSVSVWHVGLGVLVLTGSVAAGYAISSYRRLVPISFMGAFILGFGILPPEKITSLVATSSHDGPLENFLGIEAVRKDLETSGFRILK